MSSVVTFQDFNVFDLHISRLQCQPSLHFKTSMSSVVTLQDFKVFCLLHFQTSTCSVFTFHDFYDFCLYISRLQFFCLHILRLQCLLSLHLKTSILFHFGCFVEIDTNYTWMVLFAIWVLELGNQGMRGVSSFFLSLISQFFFWNSLKIDRKSVVW